MSACVRACVCVCVIRTITDALAGQGHSRDRKQRLGTCVCKR